jgi:uncharacterized OB-fold protein
MAGPFRILPELTKENEHFWRGGEAGELRFLRCLACRTYVHPPAPVCPSCFARELAAEAVSGRGTVYSFTVNHQAWVPNDPVPYVIAIVELDEQAGLRLTTNIVGCAPEAVKIGMRVRVVFEPAGDVFVPLFEPAEGP